MRVRLLAVSFSLDGKALSEDEAPVGCRYNGHTCRGGLSSAMQQNLDRSCLFKYKLCCSLVALSETVP